MSKNETMRKSLIIILTILLAVLVVVGLVMMNKGEKKNNTKEKNKTNINTNTNNLCVEKLCISKVSIEEVKSSKSIYIELQNTNKHTLKNYCVNIKTKELEIPTCIESLEPEETVVYIYEYNDMYGKKLKDYSIEKVEE